MGGKKKYTIQDIARELNTTASTVSRALQDHPRISSQMRKAVKDLAESMGYHPDFRAQSLKKGRGRTIGVIVPHIDRHFFSSVLRGIDEIAAVSDYNVLICQSYESYDKEVSLLKSLMHGRVDGMLISIASQTHNPRHFHMLIERGLPLVFFDRVWEGLPVSRVVVDDYQGARMSVEHLIGQGCRRIAHFAGPQHINIYQRRTQGYRDTLNMHNIPVDDSLIFHNVITRETGCGAMQQILCMAQKPDAVFSSGDYSVLGAMMCARDAGVKIPDDVAFCGFANEPFDAMIDPTLTSVDQHGIEMGRQAAQLLIEEMEASETGLAPRTVMLEPELIVRQSTHKLINSSTHESKL